MRPDFDSWEWRHAIDHRNRYLPNVPIYDELPEGWRVIKNTLTQPTGTCWICNGPFFQMRREGTGNSILDAGMDTPRPQITQKEGTWQSWT